MRRLSMATRDELVRAVSARYRSSGRAEKTAILNEFTALTGFHRKHAVRLLRGGGDPPARRRPRPALYGEAAREAMLILWEASDRVCGKRLRAMVPLLVEAMERHGHLNLAPEVSERVMAMSGTHPVSAAAFRYRGFAEVWRPSCPIIRPRGPARAAASIPRGAARAGAAAAGR